MSEQGTQVAAKMGRSNFETPAEVDHHETPYLDRDLQTYENVAQETLMSNPVIVGPFSMTEALAVTFDPVLLILQSPVFQQFRTWSPYAKFDVKMMIRIVASPAHYGTVLVNWFPGQFVGSAYRMENRDPHILDISKIDTYEIIIPFTTVNEWYHTYSLKTEFYYSKVNLGVKIRSLDSMAVAPFIEVYLSPINLKLQGTTAAGQMIVTHHQGYANPILVGAAASTIAGAVMPSVGDVARGVSNFVFNTVSRTAKPEHLQQIRKGMSEARTKQKQKEELDTDPSPQVLVEDEPQLMRQNVFGPMNDLSYMPAMCLNGKESRYIRPYHLADTEMTHQLLDIAKIPCIANMFWMTPGVSTRLDLKINSGAYGTYAAQIAKLFRFWRGSFYVTFKLYTSPLVTAKFSVSMTQSVDTPPTLSGPAPFFKTLTIRGSETVTIFVPFVSTNAWLPCGEIFSMAQQIMSTLFFGVSQVTAGGDTTPSVMVAIILRMGDDLQFRSLRSPVSYVPVAQGQYRVQTEREFDLCPVGYESSKLEGYAEDMYTAEMVLNHWSQRPTIGLQTMFPFESGWYQNPMMWDTYDFVSNMFCFRRGNVRVRVENKGTIGTHFRLGGSPNGATITDQQIGNGLYVNDGTLNSVNEVELPFLSVVEWARNEGFAAGTYPPRETLGISTSTDIPVEEREYYYVAAGRSHQVAMLMPPYSVLALNWA